MKLVVCIFSLVWLMSFTTACNKKIENDNGIQREESIGGDDLRETDSYKQTLPAPADEEMQENKDTIRTDQDESIDD